MNKPDHSRSLSDPAVLESVGASLVLLVLTGGVSLILSWLWVWRWALIRVHSPLSGVVLVCGHRLVDNRPSDDYVRRLARAAKLLESRPQLRIILLGGGQPSEAGAGRDWLLANADVDPARIELEEDSTDSLENLRHARDLISTDEQIFLLSSRYHLGRLKLFSRQLGLNPALVAAEPALVPGWRNLVAMVQESIYVCWFASGSLWARLARRQYLLEKIR